MAVPADGMAIDLSVIDGRGLVAILKNQEMVINREVPAYTGYTCCLCGRHIFNIPDMSRQEKMAMQPDNIKLQRGRGRGGGKGGRVTLALNRAYFAAIMRHVIYLSIFY